MLTLQVLLWFGLPDSHKVIHNFTPPNYLTCVNFITINALKLKVSKMEK